MCPKYDDMIPVTLFANRELLDRHNDLIAHFAEGIEIADMERIVRAVNIYDEVKEAFECVEYALTHPGSKQQFALMVVQHMLEKMK